MQSGALMEINHTEYRKILLFQSRKLISSLLINIEFIKKQIFGLGGSVTKIVITGLISKSIGAQLI